MYYDCAKSSFISLWTQINLGKLNSAKREVIEVSAEINVTVQSSILIIVVMAEINTLVMQVIKVQMV